MAGEDSDPEARRIEKVSREPWSLLSFLFLSFQPLILLHVIPDALLCKFSRLLKGILNRATYILFL